MFLTKVTILWHFLITMHIRNCMHCMAEKDNYQSLVQSLEDIYIHQELQIKLNITIESLTGKQQAGSDFFILMDFQ